MPGTLGAVHDFDTISEFNNRYKQRMPLPGSLLDGLGRLGRLGNRLQQTPLVRSTVYHWSSNLQINPYGSK